jgi:hypothetical protein
MNFRGLLKNLGKLTAGFLLAVCFFGTPFALAGGNAQETADFKKANQSR